MQSNIYHFLYAPITSLWVVCLMSHHAVAIDSPDVDPPLAEQNSPLMNYAEFNNKDAEDANLLFTQFGRFFAVSLGTGVNGVTGNRGLLWNTGMPMFSLYTHYWFDFNYAISIGAFTVSHTYETNIEGRGQTRVNLFHFGAHLKYYVDAKDLSSIVGFANPYGFLGGGFYYKTENVLNASTQFIDPDSNLGGYAGIGFEFILQPSFSYLDLEIQAHYVSFLDTTTLKFNSIGLPNLGGLFVTVSMHLLFAW